MSKELIAATERELADWPGATMQQEQDGGKHGRITLHFGGQSRLVIVAKSPSDVRAVPNHIATVRRELRGMGAERARVVVGKDKPPREFTPATHKPLEVLEQIVSQPKKTADKFQAIFDAIGDLRYGEMIDFAGELAEVASVMKLRRSEPLSWARTLQYAIDLRADRQ